MIARTGPQFTKPALIAWSADDTFFAVDDGRRLADPGSADTAPWVERIPSEATGG